MTRMMSKTSNGVIDNARDGMTRITFQGAIGTTAVGEVALAHIMVKASRDHQEDFSNTTHRAEALEREQEPGHTTGTTSTAITSD